VSSAELIDLWDEMHYDQKLSSINSNGKSQIPGRGSIPATFFIVGRAPDAVEEVKGKLLTGKSGKALRSLVEDVAGLTDWWYTTVTKHHLLGNRAPTTEEMFRCLPYLRREWAAVGGSKVIITIGGAALATFSEDTRTRASNCIGEPVYVGSRWVIWPMLNVADALAEPGIRDIVEAHWTALGEWVRQEGIL
jgi:uracil-DNA glycosylase family 4